MPLAPAKAFAFDQTWPTGDEAVYMTANKVWYPLNSQVLLLAAFAHLIGEILNV